MTEKHCLLFQVVTCFTLVFRLSRGSSRQQGSLGPSRVGKSCSCLCTSGWSSIGAMACDCYWQLGMWCFRNWANIGGMERWKRRFKPSKAGKQRIVFSFTSFLGGFVLEQLRVNKSSAFLFRSWKPPHSAPRKVVLNWRPCCNGWQPVKVNDACCTFPSSWKWDQSLWLKHEAWVLYVWHRNACMYRSECFRNTTTLSLPIHSPYIPIVFWSNPILLLCFGVAFNCFYLFQQGVGALESRPVSPGGHGGSAVWCFDERAEAKEGQWHLRAFEAWSLMGWA